MKTYTPPKNTNLLWQIRIGVMSTVVGITLFFAFRLFKFDFIIYAAANCVLALVALFLIFFYIPAYFKRYSIIVSSNVIIIKSGVFLSVRRVMPEARMLYHECYQTPLSRALGLSGLVFRAARAATFCAELNKNDIDEILKELSH